MAGKDCTPCAAAAAKRAAARAETTRTMADGTQLATTRGRAASPAVQSRGKAYEIRDETGVAVGRAASTLAASKLAAQHPGATVHIV